MKLFKSLLVAPAALGLLAPVAVNATEVNIDEISNYSDLESFELVNSFDKEELTHDQLIAGGEGLVDSHSHDGGFSETTTASFSAEFGIGAVDGTAGEEAVTTAYGFQIDLSTSFTGEDSFDVSIDAGTPDNATTLDELDFNDVSDALQVDGISYTFPLGDKVTAFVGDNMDGSTLYSTACVYGGVTNTLDDCGNGNSAMVGNAGTTAIAAGASIEIGNGFTAALGYTGDGSTSAGLLTKEGNDVYGGQLTYTADSYGASVTYANVESADDTTYWGLNGYWTPAETGTAVPSISVGYEMGDPTTAVDTEQWFVGLQWDEIGPGTLGAAVGTNGAISEGATDYYMYEAFYTYPINDGMTITPLIYVAEGTTDQTGVMVQTTFSF
tara:strand:- start:472 stop:1620 length:1149 start_codon:yes stop_codon:yes gene_type:complete